MVEQGAKGKRRGWPAKNASASSKKFPRTLGYELQFQFSLAARSPAGLLEAAAIENVKMFVGHRVE